MYVHTWDTGFKDIMLPLYISQIYFLTFSWLWEISGMFIAPQNNKLLTWYPSYSLAWGSNIPKC